MRHGRKEICVLPTGAEPALPQFMFMRRFCFFTADQLADTFLGVAVFRVLVHASNKWPKARICMLKDVTFLFIL